MNNFLKAWLRTNDLSAPVPQCSALQPSVEERESRESPCPLFQEQDLMLLGQGNCYVNNMPLRSHLLPLKSFLSILKPRVHKVPCFPQLWKKCFYKKWVRFFGSSVERKFWNDSKDGLVNAYVYFTITMPELAKKEEEKFEDFSSFKLGCQEWEYYRLLTEALQKALTCFRLHTRINSSAISLFCNT